MIQIVNEKPVSNIVEFTSSLQYVHNHTYIAKKNNVVLKLTYSCGVARWLCLDKYDGADFFTKGFDSWRIAIKNALDKDFEVFEFENLVELGEWLVANG